MTKQKNVWLEDKLNLLRGLVDITRKDFFTVLQLLLLMFIAGMLYFGYLYLNTKIEQINKTINPSETNVVVENSRKDKKINEILDDLRVEGGADRAKFFQFHNGQRNLQNIPFLFASVTHERIGLGVSSEIQSLQRIPSSIFTKNVLLFSEGKIMCTIPDETDSEARRSLLERQGIKYTCSFGVYHGSDLAGFVTINYVLSEQPELTVIEQALRKASVRIGDILGGDTL